MFVDAEGGDLAAATRGQANGQAAPFAASMPNRASSLRPPPHFPSSCRRSTASLATIQESVCTNHPRPDSPFELGITLRLSPLAALRSKRFSLLFPSRALCFVLPYQNPTTASHTTSQWVASERNPLSALCVWPTLHRVAQRYCLHYTCTVYIAC